VAQELGAIRPVYQLVLPFERERRLSLARQDQATKNQELNDGALVVATRSDNQEAMAELYDRYSSVVYAVALRVIGDAGAAEDILQEVFMQLWRNPGAFDASRGNLAPWLAVIARNRAVDVLRKRRPQSDLEETVLSVEPDMAADADRGRAAERIRAALKQMQPAQRSALEMAYFQGYSHSEISTKTGEPLGTIKTRIRSGLLQLRKVMETR
jgi:RNA polymerase sigma-70 factor (ECF subfamily)